jgi:two-component system sensor histidine kinase DesK
VSVVAFLVVAILQAVACLALLRAGLGNLLGGPRVDRRLFGVALTAVGVVAGLWAFPDADVTDIQPIMFFLGALTAALTPVLSRRAMYSGIMLGAAVTTVFYASIDGGDWAGALQFGVFYLLGVGIFVLVSRLSVWMLVLVWEIEESRAVQTRLAVAEERLRFARDFHDVLGRNLTLIAVTSDLAAQLARRGDPQAVDRMLDVRGIAHESAREVREVVAGYRAADLDAELAGARSVLRAAGIGTRVIGDSSSVSGDAQAAFVWVLREATTNVIRHSNARTCTIELGVQPTSGAGGHGCAAVLRVRNDGARAADPQHAAGHGPAGHGLAGLGERVTALGGQLVAGAEPGGWFTVEARLPVIEHAPVAVESTP